MVRDSGGNGVMAKIKPYYHREGIWIFNCDCTNLPELSIKPSLILTDPPYGIGRKVDYSRFNSISNGTCKSSKDWPSIIGDDSPFDPRPLVNGTRLALFGANNFCDKLPVSKGWLIWDKTGNGRVVDNIQPDAELIWTNFVKHGPIILSYLWKGAAKESGALEQGKKSLHPTQKPVRLMEWIIELAELPNQALIYDPYMGSGPVLLAALEKGMRAIGVEIVPEYCKVAADRLEQAFAERKPANG